MSSESPWLEGLRDLTERFCLAARAELSERIDSWQLDLSQDQVHEVVGALLARQVSLATEIVGLPGVWNHHVAPILLRSMADVYIAIAWILLEPEERSRRFIYHGLGQAKLRLEHHKADLEGREPREGEAEGIAALESWIDSQRLSLLTDVNVGSWSGISARDMAREAQCLDFYNFVYTPFSACVHSTWEHLAAYNLTPCANPLHRFHSVPVAAEESIDFQYPYLAGKYLAKTFGAIDESLDLSLEAPSAFEILCSGLDQLPAPPSSET